MWESNKLLLPFQGRTMVDKIVEIVLGSDVDRVIVVLGQEAQHLRTFLGDRPVKLG